jgi:hypothetical protein
MGAVFRTIVTVGLFSVFASGAFAAPGDTNDALPNWLWTAGQPSATPDTSIFRDFQVRQASDPSAAAERQTTAASVNPAAPNLIADCPETAWCVSAGALFLERSRSRPESIITPSSGSGRILDASDFGYTYEACPDIAFMCQLPSGYLLDGRYFSDHSAGSDVDLGTQTTFRMAGIGITILGSGPVSAFESTKLDNIELNFHAPIREGCTVFTGIRYLELTDRLQVDIANPGITTTWYEENHMFGAQGGIDFDFFSPGSRLQFNGILKAGAYGNTGSNHFSSVLVANTFDSGSDTAFVGEVDFTASYQLTKHLACRAGYMALWIEGVALAPDAASTTHQVAGGTSSPVNLASGLWYNGATASLDVTW